MMKRQPSRRGGRRLLLAGSGVVGVLIGVLVLVSASFGQGDDIALRTSRQPPPAPKRAPLPPVPLADDTVAGSADPFHQVVTVPEAKEAGQANQGGPAAAAAKAAGPAAASPAAQTRAPSSGTAGTTLAREGPGGASPGDDGGRYLSLELFAILRDATGVERAELSVDGQFYSPTDGEVFADRLRLEIDGDCVEVWAGTAHVDLCLPPPTPPAPVTTMPPVTTTPPVTVTPPGRIVTAESAFLQPPLWAFPRSTQPATASCRDLSAPGWTIDDCAAVDMAEGSRTWVLESRPATADERVGATERRATVMHWSTDAGAWVVDLSFRDAVAAGIDMSVKAADLTGDGWPEMVFGFRRPGPGALFTYDVVVAEPGMRVMVAASRELYDGHVSLAGGLITDYDAKYPNGESVCCPAFLQKSVVTHWEGVFRMVEAGPVGVTLPEALDF